MLNSNETNLRNNFLKCLITSKTTNCVPKLFFLKYGIFGFEINANYPYCFAYIKSGIIILIFEWVFKIFFLILIKCDSFNFCDQSWKIKLIKLIKKTVFSWRSSAWYDHRHRKISLSKRNGWIATRFQKTTTIISFTFP